MHCSVELPPVEVLEGVLASVDADLVFVGVGADICVLAVLVSLGYLI